MKMFFGDKYEKVIDKCFGTAWKHLVTTDKRIGTFLIDHKDKKVYLDTNITGLLGISSDIGYDEMLSIIEDMNDIGKNSALKLVAIDNIEHGVTAGFASYGATTDESELPSNVYSDMKKFFDLVENNKFTYAFQPIISAYTGDIVAYEALMRTIPEIGFNPFQILQFANQYHRLYDIEKYTIHNCLRFLKKNIDKFENKQLFINTVPGYFLNEKDYIEITEEVGEAMYKAVIEVTEQSELEDADLALLKKRITNDGIELAIDDYGTGYSNTSNLLRYNPKLVKIDRSLLTNIDSNNTAKTVVGMTIEFLHKSGFLALAEGVETREELYTVIELGADLIQGFYVAKPNAELLLETPAHIKAEVEKFNAERGDIYKKLYYPKNTEIVYLDTLSTDRYSGIVLENGEYTIEGVPGQTYNINVTIKDQSECRLNIKDARFASQDETPSIKVGNHSKVCLNCEGDNAVEKKGILVPSSSVLDITGEGNLMVKAEEFNSYGIGASYESSFGTINIATSGNIDLTVNGDTVVGIGGGYSSDDSQINIKSGFITFNGSGREVIGIGCFRGKAKITASDFSVFAKLAAPSSVGMGIVDGDAEISATDYKIDIFAAGIDSVAVGSMHQGKGGVTLNRGYMGINQQGVDCIGIGTRDGELDIDISRSRIDFSCQGDKLTAFGDRTGAGKVVIKSSEYDTKYVSTNPVVIAAAEDKITIVE